MGNLCTTSKPVSALPKKEPLVFKGESNKIQYEILNSNVVSEKVDVLVNPKDMKLKTLSQPIAEKEGEKLQEEINKSLAGRETLNAGELVVTEGGKLHAGHIVHVVLPPWRGGTEQETDQFVLGIKNALVEANKLGAKTVAIPALGGAEIASFPKEDLANGLITAFVAYSKENVQQSIETVKIFSTDQPLLKSLQEAAELALTPTKADTESVARPNQNGTLHPEKPKSHSPRESNEHSAAQDTQSTQSAAKDETKEHVEAHHNKEQQPKQEHHQHEEQKIGENHKSEEHAAHETKHQAQEEVAKKEAEHHVAQNEHHVVQNEHHVVQNELHEPAVKNEELDVKVYDPANQEVSNDGNAQENHSHDEKVHENESH